MINNTPEQLTAAYTSGLETLFSLAQSTVASIEQVVALNMDAAKVVIEESMGKAKDLTSVKDPQELINFHANQMMPQSDKAIAYSQRLYEILTSAQAEFSKVAEAQVAVAHKNLNTLIDTAVKSAPAGSETSVAMVKSAVAAANTAYANLSKATKQAVEIAGSNVAAATNAAVKSATQAAGAARSKKTA